MGRPITIHRTDGTTYQATDEGDADLDEAEERRYERLADEVLDAAGMPLPEHLRYTGRPSLHGGRGHSPQVAFRVAPEVRERAEAEAARRGITVSALAREALEQHLASR